MKVGYEASFTRHFYKPQPLRPLEEIRADILPLERDGGTAKGDRSLMAPDIFEQFKKHYISVADELTAKAKQAGLLNNATGIGTEREEAYRDFLERHVPKTCDVFLGGYVFDLMGNCSKQMDIIVTGANTPRFRLSAGNRYIAPLEGTIAVAEIKSKLDKNALVDALYKCASIPSMPNPKGIIAPILNMERENWEDWPFKIIFAFDGSDAETICTHIANFYEDNPSIPIARRPNLIHVLEKYVVARNSKNIKVTSIADEVVDGSYYPIKVGADVSAMVVTLNDLQEKAFASNYLMYKYGGWHQEILRRIKREGQ